MSFEKAVLGMSSVELDAQLADVYAREFGMGKTILQRIRGANGQVKRK